MVIKIGADPELFVFKKGSKKCISAHNLIPGNKWEPHPVEKGAIQVDGVAAEFNIEPASSAEEFDNNIKTVLGALWKQVRSKDDALILRAVPTVYFTRKYWDSLPEETKALGCEPDYDAYTLAPNEKPSTDKFMRTGSGHIHISWGEETDDTKDPRWMEKCAQLVRHLDAHLYPESLKWDDDKTRQELYGKPGAFRPKKFGVEYRTLSNRWIEESSMRKYIFDMVHTITTYWVGGAKINDYSIADIPPIMKNKLLRKARLA